MKSKNNKIVSFLCVAALLSNPILTQVAYAVEAETVETTEEEVKEVRGDVQAEMVSVVEQPIAEVPVVEEILPPVEVPEIPTPEVEAPAVEEALPPQGVRPLPKPVVPETPAEVVETPEAKVGTVTLTFILDVDGEMMTGTQTGNPGEEFAVALESPGTHAFWLVEFAGDDHVQMNVLDDGTLYFSGTYPAASATYTAQLTVKEVAKDVAVNYIDQATGLPIPTAPHTTVGGEVGESVTIDGLALAGYTLVSAPSQTVIISNTGQSVTFYYEKLETTTQVNFVDENGNPVLNAPATSITGLAGSEVSFTAPTIPGYIYAGPATLTISADGSNAVATYKRADLSLTVSHVDENGTVLGEDSVFSGKVGDVGTLTPAVIPGYTFVGVKSLSVTKSSRAAGTEIPYAFGTEDETIVLEYRKDTTPQVEEPGKPTPPVVEEDKLVRDSDIKDTVKPAVVDEVPVAKGTNKDLPKTGETENIMASAVGTTMLAGFLLFFSRFKKGKHSL